MPKTIYGRIDPSSAMYLIVLYCSTILGGLEHFLLMTIAWQENEKFVTHISGSDW